VIWHLAVSRRLVESILQSTSMQQVEMAGKDAGKTGSCARWPLVGPYTYGIAHVNLLAVSTGQSEPSLHVYLIVVGWKSPAP
jgi:hypothetical protein